MSSLMSQSSRTRVNLRLDQYLLQWARWYSKQRGITLTQLISTGLQRIKDESEERVEITQL